MIPGLISKLSETVIASATTIAPDPPADILRVTGTTTIATIVAPYGGQSSLLFLVPLDGGVATTTTGNIAAAVTMPQNKVTVLTYSKTTGKWYPNISA